MKQIKAAIAVLSGLGFPQAQLNDRSALTLLALLNLTPGRQWGEANNPMMGITPIMDWVRDNYRKEYAPNTRETFRRQTMHQFVQAGLALYNPDDGGRPVNSPKAVYQIAPEALALLELYGTPNWTEALRKYLSASGSLSARYARAREMEMIPVRLPTGAELKLSPGAHSQLIREIVEGFAPRFAPGSAVVYVGDTGDKFACFDRKALSKLGVTVDDHGKMPDVVLHYEAKDWLVLVESVTSHGPVSPKRHSELAALFAESKSPPVFVTAFPTRALMARHLSEIAWETEVWVAEDPSHLIHFNGVRFLGPY